MTRRPAPDIVCIGAALWDFVGRTSDGMARGTDVPGKVTRIPGGVALNVAMTMRRFELTPTLLSAIGRDSAGDELIESCRQRGIGTDFIFRPDHLPTDRYLALEDSNGLVGAIADAATLETVGGFILEALVDGRLGSAANPWKGLVALDGNLTTELLSLIASSPVLALADLRVAPASPGKVDRLRAVLTHPGLTLYVNLAEARTLSDLPTAGVAMAADALISKGVRHVLVTDGANACADAKRGESVVEGFPPTVKVNRVTGAGDTFMAAHIVAERGGADRATALHAALQAAASYVAGEIGT
jgi:sugar/nucleoside kinase (ribokinase family)